MSPRVRIAHLPLVLCCAVLSACAGRTDPAATALSARIDTLVAESMRDGKVPGLALTVVRGDSVLHSRGYGAANLEHGVPMTDSTPVVIGSTSKTFTAFAIMQLADSGKVSLDSSVTRYVAMLRDRASGDAAARGAAFADPRFPRITLRHLLTNVSGIPAGFSGDPYDAVDTTESALERIVRDDMLPRRLDFDPGSGYEYSNRGFSLASLVVQDASGMSYEDYVTSRIMQPLGMRHSTPRFWEGPARGVVQGYRESVAGIPLPRNPSLGREWTGSGMILSTSRDAARFLSAILGGGRTTDGVQLLSPGGVAEMMRPQQKAESELGGETMYALGWEVSDVEGVTLAMKGGSVGSMGSLFALLPQRRLGIALVFNDIDYGKVQLLQNLVKLLLGAPSAPYTPLPAPPRVAASSHRISPARLAQLAGIYDTRAGIMRLAMRGDTLAGRFEGNDFVLEASSDTTFVMRSVLREQEGTTLTIRRCGATMCIWMRGDSSAVRR